MKASAFRAVSLVNGANTLMEGQNIRTILGDMSGSPIPARFSEKGGT